jgi:hypothetical protein
MLISGRIVRKHCSFFNKWVEPVTPHIPHRYSKEMARKSEVVCHGLYYMYCKNIID